MALNSVAKLANEFWWLVMVRAAFLIMIASSGAAAGAGERGVVLGLSARPAAGPEERGGLVGWKSLVCHNGGDWSEYDAPPCESSWGSSAAGMVTVDVTGCLNTGTSTDATGVHATKKCVWHVHRGAVDYLKKAIVVRGARLKCEDGWRYEDGGRQLQGCTFEFTASYRPDWKGDEGGLSLVTGASIAEAAAGTLIGVAFAAVMWSFLGTCGPAVLFGLVAVMLSGDDAATDRYGGSCSYADD